MHIQMRYNRFFVSLTVFELLTFELWLPGGTEIWSDRYSHVTTAARFTKFCMLIELVIPAVKWRRCKFPCLIFGKPANLVFLVRAVQLVFLRNYLIGIRLDVKPGSRMLINFLFPEPSSRAGSRARFRPLLVNFLPLKCIPGTVGKRVFMHYKFIHNISKFQLS